MVNPRQIKKIRFPIIGNGPVERYVDSMRRTNPNRKHGFTLAELLVVMAIIAIMFAIALPMVASVSGQTKLESAANALHAAAKMARQHAVANNQPAYLVFNTGQDDPQLAYRAYAVFSINIHSALVTQDDGYYVQGWQILPDGIILDPDSNLTENLFQAGDIGDWQGGLNKNNELRIGGTTYVTLGFKPSGEISSETQFIHLTSGTIANGRPEIFNPCPGKQIHFTTFGKSMILDTRYGEADGDFQLLGETKE